MSELIPQCYCFSESNDPNKQGYDRIAHIFASEII